MRQIIFCLGLVLCGQVVFAQKQPSCEEFRQAASEEANLLAHKLNFTVSSVQKALALKPLETLHILRTEDADESAKRIADLEKDNEYLRRRLSEASLSVPAPAPQQQKPTVCFTTNTGEGNSMTNCY